MTRTEKIVIGGHELCEILDYVDYIVRVFTELPDKSARDRRGGYFTVFDRRTMQIVLVVKIGNPAPEESRTYFKYSQEKAERLFISEELVSSYQNRDPDNGKWGGAIKTEDFILSFSGLSELGDEAVVLFTAYEFSLFTEKEVMKIAEISGNLHVESIFEKIY